jgi:histidinol-phosphate aminotransferase
MAYFRDNVERAKGYEPGFQPSQTDVVKLNTNENPYPPSPQVLKVLAELGPEQLRRYPDPKGNAFREAAAEVNGVSPENIICCNGGDELLTIAFRAFCGQKRPVAYPVPTYSLYPVLSGLQNCRAIEVPFDNEFNLPATLAGSGASLTIICNPNAPSGTFINVDEIASLADELSSVLLIDEAYVDFADQANPELIAGLMKVKDSYNVDAVAIAAATAAIKDQEYFTETVGKVKAQRKTLTEQLRALKFEVPTSYANFVLAGSANFQANALYDKLVQRNIYVRFFDLPGLSDKLRITVGTKEQNDKLIAALKEIISQ